MKLIKLYAPENLVDRLKQATTLNGQSTSEFIRRAIEAALKEMKL